MHDALFALLPIFVLIALGFASGAADFLPDAVWEARRPAGLLHLLSRRSCCAIWRSPISRRCRASAPSCGRWRATLVATLLRDPVAPAGAAHRRRLRRRAPGQHPLRTSISALAAGAASARRPGAIPRWRWRRESVPLVNVISALALAPKGHGIERTVRAVVLRNPLVLACAAGDRPQRPARRLERRAPAASRRSRPGRARPRRLAARPDLGRRRARSRGRGRERPRHDRREPGQARPSADADLARAFAARRRRPDRGGVRAVRRRADLGQRLRHDPPDGRRPQADGRHHHGRDVARHGVVADVGFDAA